MENQMSITAIICTLLSAGFITGAIIYQRRDHVQGYGSTMGGQMVSSFLWLLASVSAGIAAGMELGWYWGIAGGIILFIGGFAVRNRLESISSRKQGK